MQLLTKELEVLKETVLQWILSCETGTQLENCRRFIDQKKLQLKNEAPPGFFENIENAIVNKAVTIPAMA